MIAVLSKENKKLQGTAVFSEGRRLTIVSNRIRCSCSLLVADSWACRRSKKEPSKQSHEHKTQYNSHKVSEDLKLIAIFITTNTVGPLLEGGQESGCVKDFSDG